MHQAIAFIQDLAVIMLIAGVTTVLCHRFKQPVVLGYIIAGIIVGPHTPPFQLIYHKEIIDTLGELGVVFLLFSLGLEFSLKKLARVGATAFVAATFEIMLMIWLGYQIGHWFGWQTMDAIFLGAMLAISSTTIIVKALDELKLKHEHFAQLIFGILIVEDVLAIAIIALLSGIASGSPMRAAEVFGTVARLALFMTVSLVVGITIVPRLIHYVARYRSDEMLLVTVLGLCFGFCYLVIHFGYSIALGAFLIGAIIAESRELHWIEKLVAPLRDMFSAIFFVTIGLMLDPRVLAQHAGPIALVTVAVIVGKIISCSLGAFIAGNDGRTSMRVGMGVAQIGEFSFIIASLGITLHVTSGFLYPVAVAVSLLTTLTTPYLIRAADPFSQRLANMLPQPITQIFGIYRHWLSNRRLNGIPAAVLAIVRRIVLQITVNLALVVAIFIAMGYFATSAAQYHAPFAVRGHAASIMLWGAALLLSSPFLIALYRRFKVLARLLARGGLSPTFAKHFAIGIRRVMAELLPVIAMGSVFMLVAALSGAILPPAEWLTVSLAAAALLMALLWRWLIRLHARLQIALRETFDQQAD